MSALRLPPGWNQPWWKPALGIPLYLLAGALMLGGLLEGISVAVIQGLELLSLALVADDAGGVRRRIPVLNSPDKALAAGGWVVLLLAAGGLAVALPEL